MHVFIFSPDVGPEMGSRRRGRCLKRLLVAEGFTLTDYGPVGSHGDPIRGRKFGFGTAGMCCVVTADICCVETVDMCCVETADIVCIRTTDMRCVESGYVFRFAMFVCCVLCHFFVNMPFCRWRSGPVTHRPGGF